MCIHLRVFCVHFRSRDKDDGYTIRSGVFEKPTLHANIMTVCLHGRSQFYIVRIGIFDLFGSCDLDLDPMIFIYELDPLTVEIQRMCKHERPMSRLSKVRQTDTHTYRHTETTKIIIPRALGICSGTFV